MIRSRTPTEASTIVGGLVSVGGIWWGVRRFKNPPIIVSIKPGRFAKG